MLRNLLVRKFEYVECFPQHLDLVESLLNRVGLEMLNNLEELTVSSTRIGGLVEDLFRLSRSSFRLLLLRTIRQ